MINKNLLILDKDGTVTIPISGGTFCEHPEDQQLVPDVKYKVQKLLKAGWHVALCTNQGGVASGYKSLKEAFEEVHFAMRSLGLDSEHPATAMIAHSYENTKPEAYLLWLNGPSYETFLITGGDRAFRKPGDGMIRHLGKMDKADERYERIVFVGDRSEDKTAAALAGVEFQWSEGWEIL